MRNIIRLRLSPTVWAALFENVIHVDDAGAGRTSPPWRSHAHLLSQRDEDLARARNSGVESAGALRAETWPRPEQGATGRDASRRLAIRIALAGPGFPWWAAADARSKPRRLRAPGGGLRRASAPISLGGYSGASLRGLIFLGALSVLGEADRRQLLGCLRFSG